MSLQQPIADLLAAAPTLDESIDDAQLDAAASAIERIAHPLGEADVRALISVLPASGDTAYGLNWTLLHLIEASEGWPRRELLGDLDNAWVRMLRERLADGGDLPAGSASE